jgi:hypothetical protein
MSEKRPLAVVFVASWAVLLGLVDLVLMSSMPGALAKVVMLGLSASHFYAAVGLFFLCEWGRQRALQLAVFDVLNAVILLLSGHLSPFGGLLQVGMPLFVLHALHEGEVRRRFS